jgi:hypothetical protein
MSKKNEIAPRDGAGVGVPAHVVEDARSADVRREAAGAEAHAAQAAARMAEARGETEKAQQLVGRWRRAEEEQLLAAVDIGRLVDRPGQGKRKNVKTTCITVEKSVSGLISVDAMARLLDLSPSTIARFADAAAVYDRHRHLWDAYVARQRALKKRPVIHELAAQLPKPNAPAKRGSKLGPVGKALKLIDVCVYELLMHGYDPNHDGPQEQLEPFRKTINEIARGLAKQRQLLLRDHRPLADVEFKRGVPEPGDCKADREISEALERDLGEPDWQGSDDGAGDDQGGDA